MKKCIAVVFVFIVGAFVAACGSGATSSSLESIVEKKVNDNLTVTLLGNGGKLENGEQEIRLKFTDGTGNPVELKAASLNFNMPAMGSMAEMNNAATLTTTDTPGEFSGNLDLPMAGEWQAQISYEGAETGKTSIPVTAY